MCGCSGGSRRSIGRPTPRVQTVQSARLSPTRIQALSIFPSRSPSGMSQERRFIERKRRAAIAKRVLG